MARPVRFKDAIYQSATRLFSERGLSGTGIREIAKEAGVSEAALYRHWRGKRQLARDIFVQGMTEMHRAVAEGVPQDGPICDAVLNMVRICYQAYDRNPVVFQYLLLSQHELWRTIEDSDPNPVAFWFELLRARAPECKLDEYLANEVLGPITLGMILRPSIAAAYGSIELPLSQHATSVAVAICRVLGVPWAPTAAVSPPADLPA
jgi:AcrR family transcriptional regulator